MTKPRHTCGRKVNVKSCSRSVTAPNLLTIKRAVNQLAHRPGEATPTNSSHQPPTMKYQVRQKSLHFDLFTGGVNALAKGPMPSLRKAQFKNAPDPFRPNLGSNEFRSAECNHLTMIGVSSERAFLPDGKRGDLCALQCR